MPLTPAHILTGDCLAILPSFPANSVDCCITDPPYHLTTNKRGGTGLASLNLNSPAGRSRIGTGFMGKAWDGGDVSFRPETWQAVLRVLKPGAHLAVFGGTRTFHRIACAIEDAGAELRDTLMWVYGSGFPKSSNQEGAWEGWGTALKPAWEPIILARKPFATTVEKNLAAFGTGALNIEACRVEGPGGYEREGEASQDRRYTEVGATNFAATPGPRNGDPAGRWPANLLHDGSDEVLDVFPNAPGQMAVSLEDGEDQGNRVYGKLKRGGPTHIPRKEENKNAARFFYCAKASRAERGEDNSHPTVKPIKLNRWLCRLLTPPNGLILDAFVGSGSTAIAARLENFRFVGTELNPDYVAIAKRRLASS